MLLVSALPFLTIAVGPNQAKAEMTVAAGFSRAVSPDGYWVEDPYYGTVWYPSRPGRDWRPYSYGQWVWTSDYRWYWESDEPWGWATYRYGRWVYTVQYGWVWVPGDEWGPAWVEWRYGGGYVGWAPMPPEVMWRNNAVFYGSVDLAAPRCHPGWVCGRGRCARQRKGRTLPASQNGVLLGATARGANYAGLNGRIVNRGVDVTRLSAATQLRIDPVRVVRSETHTGAGARTAGQRDLSAPRGRASGGRTAAGETAVRFDVDDVCRVGRRSFLRSADRLEAASISGGAPAVSAAAASVWVAAAASVSVAAAACASAAEAITCCEPAAAALPLVLIIEAIGVTIRAATPFLETEDMRDAVRPLRGLPHSLIVTLKVSMGGAGQLGPPLLSRSGSSRCRT